MFRLGCNKGILDFDNISIRELLQVEPGIVTESLFVFVLDWIKLESVGNESFLGEDVESWDLDIVLLIWGKCSDWMTPIKVLTKKHLKKMKQFSTTFGNKNSINQSNIVNLVPGINWNKFQYLRHNNKNKEYGIEAKEFSKQLLDKCSQDFVINIVSTIWTKWDPS